MTQIVAPVDELSDGEAKASLYDAELGDQVQEIVVLMKDGTVRRLSTKNWTVKKRDDQKTTEAAVVGSPTRHEIGALTGFGPYGLSSSGIGNGGVRVEERYAVIFGSYYSYSFTSFSIMVNGYTNGTVSLGGGVKF